ncbi:hypothetical protein [Streptomyces sp. NPDC051776]|uniref:hypothetical protein n=1 Tax=Streptomyces sp. NPDC051776 TaxID=3155414 RepID=UPI00341F6462
MRAHKIATATMLVLAVSGWGVVAGAGAAYAETGPTHGGGKAKTAGKGHHPAHEGGGRAKARAEGGSSTGGDIFQQNIAQSARQNNNCNNPNTGADADDTVLTDSRVRGRCVTADGSLTAFSRIQGGSAHARGGASSTLLAEQTIAQRGRQNNNCDNPNNAPIDLENSRLEGLCFDQDRSVTHTTLVQGGGAHAHGGSGQSSTGFVGVGQQNIAQVGRQNNNCNNPQRGFQFDDAVIDLDDSQVKLRCGNKDTSFTKHTWIKSGGARAEGGSGTGGFPTAGAGVDQQGIAQEGRQNNNCINLGSDSEIEDTGQLTVHCENKDVSFTQHARLKTRGARAQSGNATGGAGDVVELEQQNIAQEGRQNNNCTNAEDTSDFFLGEGGRVASSCGNNDASFSSHTLLKSGGARAQGGSGTSVGQQNMAQEGRQNNNCNDGNASSGISPDAGGRVQQRCGNRDHSFSHKTLIKGGGARAQGGSTTGADVAQQNVAQEGRQNNNCNTHNNDSDVDVSPGQARSSCGNKDASFSKHTRIKGGGARAHGGSSTGADVGQQNIAQEGRQNNTCHNLNAADIDVDGGRETSRCGNKDASFSKHTHIKGGGARADGGSTTVGAVAQQNIAQVGRQNNNCTNPNPADEDISVDSGRQRSRCGNKDASFSKHTHIKGGGARADGGSTTGDQVIQQNIAQEGRQNNNCANPNFPSTTLDSGRERSRCGNKDASFSKHTHIKGGGARADGGSGTSTDTDVIQQNIAQEGRQNNTCNNSNEGTSGFLTVDGGRVEGRCGNKDASFNHKTFVKGGGARVEGGSSPGGDLFAQNIAQEGRQNNTCNSRNSDATITVTGGRVEGRCGNKDASFNHKTFVKGGGARVEGGSSTGGTVTQQNIAQEGRQNNSCNNPNFPTEEITLTDSRSTVRCKTVDGSANLRTTDIGGRATAEGGSATVDLFQQNTAQEGRQSNTCANPNNLTLTTTSSRTQTQCTALDRSTNIGSDYR